jgi:hypothetical protein
MRKYPLQMDCEAYPGQTALSHRPRVSLISLRDIVEHEATESPRTDKLISAIRQDRAIRNPLCVLDSPNKKYLLLDGANRLRALKALGATFACAQIVTDQEIVLDSWEHLIEENGFAAALSDRPEWVWEPLSNNHFQLEAIRQGGTLFGALRSGDTSWHDVREFLSACARYSPIERQLRGMRATPETGTVLVRFPSFNIGDVVLAGERGYLFPSGVTRFLIRDRVLNLMVPLDFLLSKTMDPVRWRGFVNCRLNRARSYQESVLLIED